MAGMNDWLDRQYVVAKPPAAAPKLPSLADPFAGMKAGEQRSFGSFNAQQVGVPTGGVTVVRGVPSAAGAIDGLLMRGFTPEQATSMTSGATAADKLKVDTTLAPAESLARNAQALSTANVNNVSARLAPAESASRIAATGAEIGLTRANTQAVMADKVNRTKVTEQGLKDARIYSTLAPYADALPTLGTPSPMYRLGRIGQ